MCQCRRNSFHECCNLRCRCVMSWTKVLMEAYVDVIEDQFSFISSQSFDVYVGRWWEPLYTQIFLVLNGSSGETREGLRLMVIRQRNWQILCDRFCCWHIWLGTCFVVVILNCWHTLHCQSGVWGPNLQIHEEAFVKKASSIRRFGEADLNVAGCWVALQVIWCILYISMPRFPSSCLTWSPVMLVWMVLLWSPPGSFLGVGIAGYLCNSASCYLQKLTSDVLKPVSNVIILIYLVLSFHSSCVVQMYAKC